MLRTDIHLPFSAKPKVRIWEDEEGLHLRRRTGSILAGVFLSLWWIGWSAGCVLLTIKFFAQPILLLACWAMIFWTAWLGAIFFIRHLFWGVEELCIGRDQLAYGTGIRRAKWERQVPLDQVRGVRWFEEKDIENPYREYGFLIKTAEETIRFGKGIKREESQKLSELIRARFDEPIRSQEEPVYWNDPEQQPEDIEILPLSEIPVAAPPDARMRLDAEGGTLQFTSLKPSQNSYLLSILGVCFFAAFWNGIVVAFIYKLIHEFEWELFFFLIPFELIGLGLIGWVIWISLAPWRHVSYAFTKELIGRRVSMWSWKSDRFFPAENLDRVELRRPTNPDVTGLGVSFFDVIEDYHLQLAFVDTAGEVILEICHLTEAEARWIADVLLREYHDDWFAH